MPLLWMKLLFSGGIQCRGKWNPLSKDFLDAFEGKSGDTVSSVEAGDCWWTDETKTDYIAVRLLYTEEDTYFYWIAQNNAAYNEYGARLGPMI